MSAVTLLSSLRDPRFHSGTEGRDSTSQPTPPCAPSAEQVVLVHGTYAARSSDQGDSWWQEGSSVWTELQKRLPHHVCLAKQGDVFHWSGENSERARIKAALALVAHLNKLEAAGTRYHLIGHSHGGSVIWHALRLAKRKRIELPNLQSWTTVGTPFLHHRTRGAWNVVNLFNLVLACILFRPAIATLYSLITVVVGPALGLKNVLYVKPADIPENISLLQRPVLWMVQHLGLYAVDSEGGVRIGSYDPAGSESVYAFLFTTVEGWVLLGLAAFVIYVYMNLASFFLSSFLESQRIRSEKRLDEAVRSAFRPHWLGLWSPDDEAINGLRATLSLKTSFVGRMVPRERVLFSDHLSLLSRPYYWVLAPLFNRFARPAVDSLVRSFVIKTAQGNNRPAAEVVEVSSTPWKSEQTGNTSPLPEWLNQKIVDSANEHSREIAPKLRKMLAGPAFVGGPEAFGAALSGRELVHTSYFDHPEILNLLAKHIASSNSMSQPDSMSRPNSMSQPEAGKSTDSPQRALRIRSQFDDDNTRLSITPESQDSPHMDAAVPRRQTRSRRSA